jgi:hypothetical protein
VVQLADSSLIERKLTHGRDAFAERVDLLDGGCRQGMGGRTGEGGIVRYTHRAPPVGRCAMCLVHRHVLICQ